MTKNGALPRNFTVNNLNQLVSERDDGATTFAGFVNEPASVKVNGNPAVVLSTDGGAPYRFESVVKLDGGSNTIVVEAKDGQNNVAAKTYTLSASGASKRFEFDANGNQRFEKLPAGSPLRECRWDQQNRLVKELHVTHESAYEYDGESRRVRIKEIESSVETKNEIFIWCGPRICQKRASNGSTVLRNYFNEGFEQGNDDYFYTREHLGSIREVVGSDGTTISGRITYDPWGQATETGALLSDFGYTGHYFDRPTGLNLALYRGYSPLLGRWLSMDPIGLRGGWNLYVYVINDPIRLADPTGLEAETCYKCPDGQPYCGHCDNGAAACRQRCEDDSNAGYRACVRSGGSNCEAQRDRDNDVCRAKCRQCPKP